MKRRIFALMMALAMTALLLAGCQSGGNVAASNRSGVVRVIALYDVNLYRYNTVTKQAIKEGSGTRISFGSAFGVGNAGKETDVFVTNRHVIQKNLDTEIYKQISETEYYLYGDQTLTNVYIFKDDYAYTNGNGLDTSRAVPARVIYEAESGKADLAVLRAAEPVAGRKALYLLDEHDDGVDGGDTVYALGYPGSTDRASMTEEKYSYAGAVESATITNGVVSLHTEFVNEEENRIEVIQHTATINHGNSGGALIDERGVVVGVNTWGYGQNVSTGDTGANASIEIHYVRDILDGLHVEYDTYKPLGKLLLIGGIAAAVLILAAVIVLAVLRKKKGKVQPVVVSNEVVPTVSALPQEYRLQGVNGVFAGRRFAIEEGIPVRIGTDPTASDLIIPAGTSGVSRRHCVVTLRNGQLYIQDVGSTYGTMVGSQRLIKDQPVLLRMGDRFCLGSDQQCFIVTGKGGV